jgi:2-polyprenyl-3-methyl-5-hydroxy-6-metoxy-1,4-benzoquinol methylase
MLAYTKTALESFATEYRDAIATWNGIDIKPDYASLERTGYDNVMQANVENETADSRDFDVCILLHVIEHFASPEKTLQTLFTQAPPGSLFAIGYPAHFDLVRRMWEPHIRTNPRGNGHLSVISDLRVHQILKQNKIQRLANQASFFLRATRSLLEDNAWWYRFNYFWGLYAPFWFSEHTVICRKDNGG